METLTPDDTALSARSAATAATAALLSALLVAPALLLPAYGRWVALALLAVGVAGAARLVVATVAAAPRREPPALPAAGGASDGSAGDPGTLPTVSLVVTAYDEADALPATLDACLGVDYPADRLEVVVGYEAASTDGTAAVAEAAADSDPRVAAVERPEPPGGKAAATNHALAAATGGVVGVLDADQRLEPDAVSRAVRWLADDGVACVKGRCLGTNPGDSPISLCATAERGLVERTEFVARDRLGGFALFTGGQAFFDADALAAAGEFDETVLLEDLDMAYRLQRAGGAVRVDPGIVTRETNPAAFGAWWSQRKRWARGGMQVASRHLPDLRSAPPPLAARADLAATLGTLLAVPLLVLAAPAGLFAGGGGTAAVGSLPQLTPFASLGSLAWLGPWLVAFVLLAPAAAWYGTLALDARDGRGHRPVEYAAPLLLWPYVAVQVWAVVAAFVDEFVLRRPSRYVTS